MAPLNLYIVCLLGAVGVYLVVRPGGLARVRARPVRFAGSVLGLVALGALILRLGHALAPAGGPGAGTFHALFTLIAVACAVAMITTSRPVYSALYFVLVVLASAALFLLMEAEFMAFALVIVYAGAILITYMFVLMLAQQSPDPDHPEAQAEYDLHPREPAAGAVVGFILLALLTRMAYDGVGELEAPTPVQARIASWRALEAMPQRVTEFVQRELGDDVEPLRREDGTPRIDVVADGQRVRGFAWVAGPEGDELRVELPEQALPENTQLVGVALVAKLPGTPGGGTVGFPASLELAGVILLMAMFGAVILARRQIELTEDDTREAAGLRRLGHHDEPQAAEPGGGAR